MSSIPLLSTNSILTADQQTSDSRSLHLVTLSAAHVDSTLYMFAISTPNVELLCKPRLKQMLLLNSVALIPHTICPHPSQQAEEPHTSVTSHAQGDTCILRFPIATHTCSAHNSVCSISTSKPILHQKTDNTKLHIS